MVLSWDNVVKYWGRLMTRYAAVQTFNVTLHADAVPVGFSCLGNLGLISVHVSALGRKLFRCRRTPLGQLDGVVLRTP